MVCRKACLEGCRNVKGTGLEKVPVARIHGYPREIVCFFFRRSDLVGLAMSSNQARKDAPEKRRHKMRGPPPTNAWPDRFSILVDILEVP